MNLVFTTKTWTRVLVKTLLNLQVKGFNITTIVLTLLNIMLNKLNKFAIKSWKVFKFYIVYVWNKVCSKLFPKVNKVQSEWDSCKCKWRVFILQWVKIFDLLKSFWQGNSMLNYLDLWCKSLNIELYYHWKFKKIKT